MRSSGKSGVDELRAVLKASAAGFLAIGLFSFFVNLLVLTGPLFMLQIYDRVLASRSEATLVVRWMTRAAVEAFSSGSRERIRR